MTLRLKSGSLLMAGGSLANDNNCCCCNCSALTAPISECQCLNADYGSFLTIGTYSISVTWSATANTIYFDDGTTVLCTAGGCGDLSGTYTDNCGLPTGYVTYVQFVYNCTTMLPFDAVNNWDIYVVNRVRWKQYFDARSIQVELYSRTEKLLAGTPNPYPSVALETTTPGIWINPLGGTYLRRWVWSYNDFPTYNYRPYSDCDDDCSANAPVGYRRCHSGTQTWDAINTIAAGAKNACDLSACAVSLSLSSPS